MRSHSAVRVGIETVDGLLFAPATRGALSPLKLEGATGFRLEAHIDDLEPGSAAVGQSPLDGVTDAQPK